MSTDQPVMIRRVSVSVGVARQLGGIFCLAISLIGVFRPASAQEQSPSQRVAAGVAASVTAADDEQAATVVVTGTSIQSVDSAAYQSSPVSVTTADTIQKSGAASLEAFFQTQPDFVLSGQSSFSNTGGQSGA